MKLKDKIAAAKRQHAREKTRRDEYRMKALRKHALRVAIKDELQRDVRTVRSLLKPAKAYD